MSGVDDQHMARALFLAERGRGRTSPNPMVGAVVVDDDGVVVGRGSHGFAGGPHAEIYALEDAGARARGATLYCTLEPCSHTGRTGPCAPRVAAAGIRRAVIAIEDPNPLVSGRGLSWLRERGVEVSVGVMREAAERLNRSFFTVMRRARPFVTIKAALSLDGRVAAARGQRTAITSQGSAWVIHRERAEVDAIAVGSGTVLVDDPLLTARVAYRHRPLVRVIFDRRLRTPSAARVLSTIDHGPVLILTDASAPVSSERAQLLEDAGARVERVETGTDGAGRFLRSALGRLARLGMTSLLVEGGPTLQEAFWHASLVDRVELFIAPRSLGPAGLDWIRIPDGSLAGLQDLSARPVGDDVMVEGYVHRAD